MPTIRPTEASRGFGGQELRILAEPRWLLDHGWDALVACQPASPLHAEAEAAGIPAASASAWSGLAGWQATSASQPWSRSQRGSARILSSWPPNPRDASVGRIVGMAADHRCRHAREKKRVS